MDIDNITFIQVEPLDQLLAQVLVSFDVLGILPDVVEVYAVRAGSSGPASAEKMETVEMTPPGMSYSCLLELAANAFYRIHICPRTATGDALDDTIDGESWESRCVSVDLVTRSAAPPPPLPRMAPRITEAKAQCATMRSADRIVIRWQSERVYEWFFVRVQDPLHAGESQIELRLNARSGQFVLQPVLPSKRYAFKVGACDEGLISGTHCTFTPAVDVIAAPRTRSLREFLAGEAARQGVRQLVGAAGSLRGLMGL